MQRGFPYLAAVLALVFLAGISNPVTGQTPRAVKISQSEGGFGGQLKGTNFGTSVEVLGDLDGDGTIDIAVGAPGDNTNGGKAGAIWILFLNPDGTVKGEQKITAGEGGFDGELVADDQFGFGLATIDLNDDGRLELVATAPGQRIVGSTAHTGSIGGFVSVLFLESDGRVSHHVRLDPVGGLEGHIARFGDINDDGVQDLLVQGIDRTLPVGGHGPITILPLQSDGSLLGNTVLTGINISVDRVGNCEPANDLDRDGVQDLVCGGAVVIESPGETSALVADALAIVHLMGNDGRSRQSTTIDMRPWGVSYEKTSWRSEKGPSFAASTARGPTLSGLIAGTPSADGFAGGAFRVFLNRGLEDVIVQDLSEVFPGFGSEGGGAVRRGRAVAVADLDGNGLEDIFVGAPSDNDGGAERGAIWVLFNVPLPGPGITAANPVAQVSIDQDIIIESRIYDLQSVEEARLHFRRGGDPGFFSGTMTAVDDTSFVFDIPGFVAGARGIEYYVTATNEAGTESRWPTEPGFRSVSIRLPQGVSAPAPGGTAADGYRLISLPLELDDADATAVLEASFGPYNPKRWRFFQYVEGSGQNRELGEHEIVLRPGNAYWLLTKEVNRILESGPGTTVPTAEPYRLGITRGYNVIANPYNFPVRLDQIANASGWTLSDLIADGLVDEVLTYRGDWVAVADTLEPFEGYLVYPMSECIDTWECSDTSPGALYVYSDASVISAPESFKRVEIPQSLWSIRIAAQQGAARDEHNFASASTTASAGWDRRDRPEPPVIGDYVSVSFPHPEWGEPSTRFRHDTRPEPTDGDVWPIEVRTRTFDPVELRFEGLDDVPVRFKVWLLDERSGVRQNLREDPTYTLAGPGEEHPATLSLAVGTEQFMTNGLEDTRPLPTRAELLPIYPNPFGGSATIRYVLPEATSVRIEVVDVLGRRVRVLQDGASDNVGLSREGLEWPK